MKVAVVTRNGRELIKGGLEFKDSATVADLHDAIYKKRYPSTSLWAAKKFYPSRQRLTLPLPSGSKDKPVVVNSMKSIKDYTDGNTTVFTVVFKDLGPQVSYSTLFFFEYLGPLFIDPIFYYFNVYELLGYKGKCVMCPVQTYAM